MCGPRLFPVIILPPCRRVVLHLNFTLFSAQPRFGDLIDKLVATTDEVIYDQSSNISASSEAQTLPQRTQSRMSPVTLAWSVSQRASRGINIQTTIECVTSFLLLNFFLMPYTTELGKAVSGLCLPQNKGQLDKVTLPT
jgi:hypothetical protein